MWRLVLTSAGGLLLFCVIPPSSAKAVAFDYSEPVIVDTTIEPIPVDAFPGQMPSPAIDVAEGSAVNLILFKSDELTLVRITKNGELIDTIPKLHRPTSILDDHSYAFTTWCDPFFYIFEYGTDSVYFTRIRENLTVIDRTPVPVLPRLDLSTRILADGCDVWTVEKPGGFLRFNLYQLPDFTQAFDPISVPIHNVPWYSTLASGGLYASVQNEIDSTFESVFVSRDGDVVRFPEVSYGGLENMRFRDKGFRPYGPDSALFTWLDRGTDTCHVLFHFCLTPTDTVNAPILRSARLDQLPSGNLYSRWVANVCQDELFMIGSYRTPDECTALFVSVDLQTDELLLNGSFTNDDLDCSSAYHHLVIDNGMVDLYYRGSTTAWHSRFSPDDPIHTVSANSVYYTTLQQQAPTIARDSEGLLMCAQQVDSAGLCLKAFRFADPQNLANCTQIVVDNPDTLAYRPWLFNLGETKVLTWLSYLDHPEGSPPRYVQKLLGFDGNRLDLDSAVNIGISPGDHWHMRLQKPDISFRSNLGLVNMPYAVYGNDYGNGTYMQILAIRIPDWWNSEVILEYTSGGYTGLLDFGDTIMLAGADMGCLERTDEGYCTHLTWDYFGNLWDPGSSTTRAELDDLGMGEGFCIPNVFGYTVDDQRLLYLSCEETLWAVNGEDWSVDHLADFAEHIGNGFPDSRGDTDNGVVTPIDAGDYYLAVTQASEPVHAKLLVFDKAWEFVDSSQIPCLGIPVEFSGFAYIPEEDVVVYAYSTWLPYPYNSTRAIVQSVRLEGPASVQIDDAVLPQDYSLSNNYPNPFNPSTSISFVLPVRSNVELIIYNALGQQVTKLIDESWPPGKHTVTWRGEDSYGRPVSTGVYFYRIKVCDFVATRKMMLLK